MRVTRTVVLTGTLLALGACGGGSSSKTYNQLTVHGGRGSDGAGGDAGTIYVYGSGGQITVKKDGGLPALPTWTYTAPELGANPLTVSEDAEFTVGDAVIGDDGVNPATGIWVKSGATATLTPEAGDTVTITVSDGVLIEGSVVMAPVTGSRDSSSLSISATSIAVRGTVRAVGLDGAIGEDGGNGGSIEGSVKNDFFLTGSILTKGGTGDAGGAGGTIDVIVDGPAWVEDVVPSVIAVTGVSDSSGGEGLAGAGGAGGDNSIWGTWSAEGACNFFNSGSIRAKGGDGTAGGGNAGSIYLSSCKVGWAASKGTIDGSGGSATVDGAGGAGGESVYLEASGGVVYAGGRFLLSGGSGAGTGGGGSGGRLYIDGDASDTDPSSALGLHVAARIDAAGGAGAAGGSGGYVEVYDEGAPTDAGITLYSYAVVDCAGGDGTTAGGAGGDCEIYPEERYDSTNDGNVVGTLTNQARVDVTGGDASAGGGGAGGYAWIGTWISDDSNPLLDPETVETVNTGEIRASGGDGTTSGGAGGNVEIYDVSSLQSKAKVDVSGGAGGTDNGGAGGSVSAYGETTCTVTGKIVASGGASASADGGAGGEVEVTGTTASLGAVTADGGAGAAATGGNGGAVALTSSTPPSTVTGTISVRPGAGTTAGDEGTFTLDGTEMPLTDGRYSP